MMDIHNKLTVLLSPITTSN